MYLLPYIYRQLISNLSDSLVYPGILGIHSIYQNPGGPKNLIPLHPYTPATHEAK